MKGEGEGLKSGPGLSRSYLNSLRGPNGEKIEYGRRGSCCHFEVEGDEFGGLLDIYELTYAGLEKPVMLYINFYESGPLLAPKGFTALKQQKDERK